MSAGTGCVAVINHRKGRYHLSMLMNTIRRMRRPRAVSVLAVALAALVLCASLALPAFGLSPSKLIAEALKESKKADKDATRADKDAKTSPVGTARLQDGAVTSTKIAAGAVGAAQLSPGAVGTADLANRAVTSATLAPGSVGQSQLAQGSVTIKDLSGTSVSTTVDVPTVLANTCATVEIPDSGAAITDFPLVSFPGPTNLPLQLSGTPVKVDIAGSVRVKLCNGTGADVSAVTGLDVVVVTLR
jgi:hypothetical protein